MKPIEIVFFESRQEQHCYLLSLPLDYIFLNMWELLVSRAATDDPFVKKKAELFARDARDAKERIKPCGMSLLGSQNINLVVQLPSTLSPVLEQSAMMTCKKIFFPMTYLCGNRRRYLSCQRSVWLLFADQWAEL
jgi:hypothetical protein